MITYVVVWAVFGTPHWYYCGNNVVQVSRMLEAYFNLGYNVYLVGVTREEGKRENFTIG